MTHCDRETFSALILEHYEDPYNHGPLAEVTHAAEATIPVFGDSMRIELCLEDDVVTSAGFQSEGCIGCQGAASIVLEWATGKHVQQIRDQTISDVLELLGEPIPVSRKKCCLLGWRLLLAAIETPAFSDEDDELDVTFGGPSLGEEC